MLSVARHAWLWWIDGLIEAKRWLLSRLRPEHATSVLLGEERASVVGPEGESLGHCIAEPTGARLEPAELGPALAHRLVDLVVPDAWIFQRTLDPVAAQSAPFLEAFVRHQIDKITPWRSSDVHYQVDHTPLKDDADRLAVTLRVVPKRPIAAVLACLECHKPRTVRLTTRTSEAGPDLAIIAFGRSDDLRRERKTFGLALAGVLAAIPIVFGLIWFLSAAAQTEVDEADRVIADRKAVMAAAARRNRVASEADDAVKRIAATHPSAVVVLDALSAALPDSSYVTDLTVALDRVRIAGVSSNAPELVPTLETSGHFAGATFFAATTRMESGAGDRFNIDVRFLPSQPKPDSP